MQTHNPQNDLTRTILAALSLLALITIVIWIVRPFLSATLWATMMVIATWPALEKLQSLLWGRRSLAAATLTVALLLLLIVPLSLAAALLVGNMSSISNWIQSLQTLTLPPPPGWVAGIPLVGSKASQTWAALAAAGSEGLLAKLEPFLGHLLQWFAGTVGSLAGMILQFLLTSGIAAILYVHGESAACGVRRFAYRLAGERCEQATLLAAGAIRGVALGVVVTALAQTVVAGTGLAIASIPGTPLFMSIILVLCLAQLGPTLVMLPLVIWKFVAGDSGAGSVLLVFAIISGGMDNFIRPVLIKRGADLPILLILAGVIGGMIGFGIMGIFVGPAILAVAYTLLKDWVINKPESARAAAATPLAAAVSEPR